MGMNGFKNGKTGRFIFLKDFTGYYNALYLKDSVHEMRFWPDEKEPSTIWWNEGQGCWNSSVLDKDVSLVEIIPDERR